MTSRIGGASKGGNWKHEHGTAHYGRNFSVKWLKVLLISLPAPPILVFLSLFLFLLFQSGPCMVVSEIFRVIY